MFKKYFLLDVIRLGDAVRLCLGQAIDLDPMRRSKAEQASYKDMVDSYGREFISRHLYKPDHVRTPVSNTENNRVSFYRWVEFLQSMEVTLPPPLLEEFRLQEPKGTQSPSNSQGKESGELNAKTETLYLKIIAGLVVSMYGDQIDLKAARVNRQPVLEDLERVGIEIDKDSLSKVLKQAGFHLPDTKPLK